MQIELFEGVYGKANNKMEHAFRFATQSVANARQQFLNENPAQTVHSSTHETTLSSSTLPSPSAHNFNSSSSSSSSSSVLSAQSQDLHAPQSRLSPAVTTGAQASAAHGANTIALHPSNLCNSSQLTAPSSSSHILANSRLSAGSSLGDRSAHSNATVVRDIEMFSGVATNISATTLVGKSEVKEDQVHMKDENSAEEPATQEDQQQVHTHSHNNDSFKDKREPETKAGGSVGEEDEFDDTDTDSVCCIDQQQDTCISTKQRCSDQQLETNEQNTQTGTQAEHSSDECKHDEEVHKTGGAKERTISRCEQTMSDASEQGAEENEEEDGQDKEEVCGRNTEGMSVSKKDEVKRDEEDVEKGVLLDGTTSRTHRGVRVGREVVEVRSKRTETKEQFKSDELGGTDAFDFKVGVDLESKEKRVDTESTNNNTVKTTLLEKQKIEEGDAKPLSNARVHGRDKSEQQKRKHTGVQTLDKVAKKQKNGKTKKNSMVVKVKGREYSDLTQLRNSKFVTWLGGDSYKCNVCSACCDTDIGFTDSKAKRHCDSDRHVQSINKQFR